MRERAGLEMLTAAELSDQSEFRLAVEHERRVGFASEGLRWLDLVRTDRYITIMTSKGFNVEEHHDLCPIPEAEILKINYDNILRQNPGY